MAKATLIAPFAQVSGRFVSAFEESTSGSGVVAMPQPNGTTNLRTNFIPSQPNSSQQILSRAQLTSMAEGFQSITLEQVVGWKVLGASLTRYNSFGQPFQPSWNQVYLMVNSMRLQNGLELLLTAPAPSAKPPLTLTSCTVEVDEPSPGVQTLNFVLADPAPEFFGHARIRVSRASTSPTLQIPDNELRIVTATQEQSWIDVDEGSPVYNVSIVATRLNYAPGDHVAIEVLTTNDGYVPFRPETVRNYTLTATP